MQPQSSEMREARRQKAQMAESVDALVSNTSGATRAGSTPALGTLKERKCAEYQQDTAHFFIFGATLVQQFGFLVVKLPFLQ